MRHDWPAKKAFVDLPIKMKGNSKRTSGNSLSPGCPEQGYRRCFADVTSRGYITSTKKAIRMGVFPFFFVFSLLLLIFLYFIFYFHFIIFLNFYNIQLASLAGSRCP